MVLDSSVSSVHYESLLTLIELVDQIFFPLQIMILHLIILSAIQCTANYLTVSLISVLRLLIRHCLIQFKALTTPFSFHLPSFAIYHKITNHLLTRIIIISKMWNWMYSALPHISLDPKLGKNRPKENKWKNTQQNQLQRFIALITILFTAARDYSNFRPTASCIVVIVIVIRQCFGSFKFLSLTVFNIRRIFFRRIDGWPLMWSILTKRQT